VFVISTNSKIVVQGTRPGHNSATGFPVRSYHLSGLLEWTAVKGELLHHNQRFSRHPFCSAVKVVPSLARASSKPNETVYARILPTALRSAGPPFAPPVNKEKLRFRRNRFWLYAKSLVRTLSAAEKEISNFRVCRAWDQRHPETMGQLAIHGHCTI
jgi:hypothetical protein